MRAESDFRSSKMAAGGHFVKRIHKPNKVVYLSEIDEKCDRKRPFSVNKKLQKLHMTSFVYELGMSTSSNKQ